MNAREPDAVRGAIAGLAAGLVAAYAMNHFQNLWRAIASNDDGAGEPATVKAANKVSRVVTGSNLARRDMEPAGEAVHYSLAAALGIAYGVAAEYRPGVTAGFGTVFGAATALALDNAVVPAAGLGDPPWRTPIGTHAYGMISHLIFGAVTEGARAAVRVVA